MKYLKVFETYKAQKEIEKLANSVVKSIAKRTIDWHIEHIWTEPESPKSGVSYRVRFKEKQTGFIDGANYLVDNTNGVQITFKGYNKVFLLEDLELTWSEINQFNFKYIIGTNLKTVVDGNYDDYDELSDFIKNTYVSIKPEIREPDNNAEGSLAHTEGRTSMSVYLYYDEILYRELRESKKSKLDRNMDYDAEELYFELFYKFYNTLLHELQHAYDAYRSKGKAFYKQTKGDYDFKKIKGGILRNSKEELREEEIEYLNSLAKEYLNFPHEINARFTQAIQRVMFSSVEVEHDGYYSVINKWEDVYRAFKSEFHGWRHLSDKDKKRLTRKLSQFYHLDMERIKEANKETRSKRAQDKSKYLSTNESAMLMAYHVTDKKNLKSILKNGLEPRVPEDFGEHGDMKGVYLFKTVEDAKNALMNWMGERIEEWEEESGETYEEVLLHVDITGLDCLDTVEFEWTCIEHIPPDRIMSVDYDV